jgi:hypothetical protein
MQISYLLNQCISTLHLNNLEMGNILLQASVMFTIVGCHWQQLRLSLTAVTEDFVWTQQPQEIEKHHFEGQTILKIF